MATIKNPWVLDSKGSKQRFLPSIPGILSANIYSGVSEVTACDAAVNFSDKLGNKVWLKREDMQQVFSFKCRGAHHFIEKSLAALGADSSNITGTICSSAGNHAQGMTISSVNLGLKATVIMPKSTPDIKVNAVRKLGGKVILHGERYDEAAALAKKMGASEDLLLVPPYDHPWLIEGQASVGVEISQFMNEHIDAVFIPIGGGGLAAGMIAYFKAIHPETKIIGVEPVDAASTTQAILDGERTILEHVGLFADGVAVSQVGEHTWPIIKDGIDAMITVSIDEICSAVKDIFEDFRVIAEPAGALATAGIRQYIEQTGASDQCLVGVLSGANTNFVRLGHIVERAEYGTGQEKLLSVVIPEKPGSFLALSQLLESLEISEFNYRFQDQGRAQVLVGIRTNLNEPGDSFAELKARMRDAGFGFEDLSEDEMAKSHLRYMIGGVSSKEQPEQVYSLTVNSSKKVLPTLLTLLAPDFNISLFHFRHHGAAYHRILIGIQAVDKDRVALEAMWDKIGARWEWQNENPGFKAFLQS